MQSLFKSLNKAFGAKALLFLIIIINPIPFKVYSQGLVTGAGILLASQNISTALGNLSPQLGQAGSSVVGTAITQLNQLTSELSQKLGTNVNVPITSLSFEVQNLARQITSAITQLNAVIDKQRNCGIQDLEMLLSTVTSITLQLKEGIPFVDQSMPRFHFYKFDGHTSGTVPKEGGQVTLTGFNLWPDQGTKPIVELWNETRTAILAKLEPIRGGSNDEVSVRISREMLLPYAGKCLYIRIRPREIQGALWWKEAVVINDLNRPMCIPSTSAVSLQLRASIQYSCPSTTRTTVNGEGFYFENHDPAHERQVSETRVLQIPEGCKIVSYVARQESITRHFRNATFGFTDKSITVNAHLGDAEDFNPPIGPRVVLTHAVWSYTVIPTIECVSNAPVTSATIESQFVNLSDNTTQLSVDIPKNCDFTTSNIRYEIWKKFGNEPPTKILESPWLPAAQAGVSNTANSDFARLTITAQYNPGITGGNAQVFTNVSVPNCGY